VGRRLATGLVAGASLLGAAITAASDRVPAWIPISLGIVGTGFTLFLLGDLLRRKR
jgi:hypothetical protein